VHFYFAESVDNSLRVLYNNPKSTCVYFVFAMLFVAISRRTHTSFCPSRMRERQDIIFQADPIGRVQKEEKMKVTLRRTLLVALLVLMVVSLTVFGISASLTSADDSNAVAKVTENGSEATYYTTLQEAVDAVSSTGTVSLVRDVELPETVIIATDKVVTVDLNGCNITVVLDSTRTDGGHIYAFNNLGTLTLKDSEGTGSVTARGIYNGYVANGDPVATAQITVESGTYYAQDSTGGSAIFNYGVATINGGEFNALNYALNNRNTMTVNNATTSESGGGVYHEGAELLINNATFLNLNGNGGQHGIYAASGTVTIENIHLVTNRSAIYLAGATVNVNGGVINNSDSTVSEIVPYVFEGVSGTLNITGGTIIGDTCRTLDTLTLNVSGGTIDAPSFAKQGTGAVTVTGGTFATEDFASYIADDSLLVNNRDGTYTTVAFDDVMVLPEGLTQANYAEAFGENTVTDGNGNYWATMQAALKDIHDAANGMTVDTLYCKPGANVGELTHGHVCGSLTVYGNDAYVSGGEHDFAIGTPQANGTTCTNGIAADMTLKVIMLDGAAAWGTPNFDHTVSVVFESCDNMHKIFLNNTVGTTNISLTGCSFDMSSNAQLPAQGCGVYSNASGTITVKDCSFVGLSQPICLNHKATGTQSVIVENVTFEACGSDSNAADHAPIRVLSSVAGGESKLTVTNATFINTKANDANASADILLDNGAGETVTAISETNAKVVIVTLDDESNKVLTPTPVTEDEPFIDNAVAEADGIYFRTLADAVAYATNTTITLLSDITDPNLLVEGGAVSPMPDLESSKGYILVTADKTIVLDLNGHTISTAVSGTIIVNRGTLTINDSSDAETGLIETTAAIYLIENRGGNLTINGGTLRQANNSACIAINHWANTTGDAYLTINGGTITSTNWGVYIYAESAKGDVNDSGTVYFTMTGGSVIAYNATGDLKTYGVYLFSAHPTYEDNGANIEISGNSVIEGGTYAYYSHESTDFIDNPNFNTTISGGTFNGTVRAKNGDITITGGTFNGAVQIRTLKSDGSGMTSLEPSDAISGGTFNAGLRPIYLASTADALLVVCVTAADGSASVYTFETMEAALTALASVDPSATVNVSFCKDLDVTDSIVLDRDMIIDGNGYVISSATAAATITVNADVVLSNIIITNTAENGVAIALGTDATLHAEPTTVLTASAPFSGYTVGQAITTTDEAFAAALNAAGYALTAATVDEVTTYTVVTNAPKAALNGWHYDTFANALADAEDGDTVSLLRNLIVGGTIVISKDITIDGNGYSITSDAYGAMFTLNASLALNNVSINNRRADVPAFALANDAGLTIEGNCSLSSSPILSGYDEVGHTHEVSVGNAALAQLLETEGYFMVPNGAYYTISEHAAAKIGNTLYETLADALYAAVNGDTIIILKNIELADTVAIDKKITIYGHFTLLTSTNDTAVFSLGENASLTINCAIEKADGAKVLAAWAGQTVKTDNVDVRDMLNAEGYAMVEETTGVWTVQTAKAKIGDLNYASLAAALAAVQDNETIVLLADAELTAPVIIDNTVTIDCGEYTVTSSASTTFVVSGTLTVNGAMVNTYATGSMFTLSNGATVAINGTVTANKVLVGYDKDLHTVTTTVQATAEKLNGEGYALVKTDSTWTVMTDAPEAKDANGWNYVTLEDALVTGGTITLLRDVTVEATIEVTGALTLTGDYTLTSTASTAFKLNAGATLAINCKLTAADVLDATGAWAVTTSVKAIAEQLNGENYSLTESAGVWTITSNKPQVAINGWNYDTLVNAIAAAQAGNTIDLLTDVTVSGNIDIVAKSLTINGNGKLVTATSTGTNVFRIYDCAVTFENIRVKGGRDGITLVSKTANTATNVVINNSTINANRYGICIWEVPEADSTLTISNTTISAAENTTVTNAGGITSSDSAVTVTLQDDVSITSTQYGIYSMGSESVKDACKYIVSGNASINGSITDVHATYNATTATFNFDGSRYVASLLGVQSNGTTRDFNVYESLADALAAPISGAATNVVTLHRNVTDFAGTSVAYPCTLDGNGYSITVADGKTAFTLGAGCTSFALNNVSVNGNILAGFNGQTVTTNMETVANALNTQGYALHKEGDIWTVAGLGVVSLNGWNYATIQEALGLIKDGESLNVLIDFTTDATIAIDKPITIYGNGKTITSTASPAINVTSVATIHDLTVDATAGNAVHFSNNLTLDNVTLYATGVGIKSYNGTVDTVTLTMEDCTVGDATKPIGSHGIEFKQHGTVNDATANIFTKDVVLTMNNSTVYSVGRCIYTDMDANRTVTITITMDTLDETNPTLTSTGNNGLTFHWSNDANVTLEKVYIKAESVAFGASQHVNNDANNPKIVVATATNCKFESTTDTAVAMNINKGNTNNRFIADITLTNCTISGVTHGVILDGSTTEHGASKLTISGGSVSCTATGIHLRGDVTASVSGASVTSTNGWAIYTEQTGDTANTVPYIDLTVTNSTLSGLGGIRFSAVADATRGNSKLTVNGGTITATGAHNAAYTGSGDTTNYDDKPTYAGILVTGAADVAVSNATISAPSTIGIHFWQYCASANLTLTNSHVGTANDLIGRLGIYVYQSNADAVNITLINSTVASKNIAIKVNGKAAQVANVTVTNDALDTANYTLYSKDVNAISANWACDLHVELTNAYISAKQNAINLTQHSTNLDAKNPKILSGTITNCRIVSDANVINAYTGASDDATKQPMFGLQLTVTDSTLEAGASSTAVLLSAYEGLEGNYLNLNGNTRLEGIFGLYLRGVGGYITVTATKSTAGSLTIVGTTNAVYIDSTIGVTFTADGGSITSTSGAAIYRKKDSGNSTTVVSLTGVELSSEQNWAIDLMQDAYAINSHKVDVTLTNCTVTGAYGVNVGGYELGTAANESGYALQITGGSINTTSDALSLRGIYAIVKNATLTTSANAASTRAVYMQSNPNNAPKLVLDNTTLYFYKGSDAAIYLANNGYNTVVLQNNSRIVSSADGIRVGWETMYNNTITLDDSTIEANGTGIVISGSNYQVAGTIAITLTNGSLIDSGTYGIRTAARISENGELNISLTDSDIEAGGHGIYVDNDVEGSMSVSLTDSSIVAAGRYGFYVNGTQSQTVTVNLNNGQIITTGVTPEANKDDSNRYTAAIYCSDSALTLNMQGIDSLISGTGKYAVGIYLVNSAAQSKLNVQMTGGRIVGYAYGIQLRGNTSASVTHVVNMDIAAPNADGSANLEATNGHAFHAHNHLNLSFTAKNAYIKASSAAVNKTDPSVAANRTIIMYFEGTTFEAGADYAVNVWANKDQQSYALITATFKNCSFTSCNGMFQGDGRVEKDADNKIVQTSTLTVENCKGANGEAISFKKAIILVREHFAVTIKNSKLTSNTSNVVLFTQNAGDINSDFEYSLYAENSTLTGHNTIYADTGDYSALTSIELKDTYLVNNKADGAAIHTHVRNSNGADGKNNNGKVLKITYTMTNAIDLQNPTITSDYRGFWFRNGADIHLTLTNVYVDAAEAALLRSNYGTCDFTGTVTGSRLESDSTWAVVLTRDNETNNEAYVNFTFQDTDIVLTNNANTAYGALHINAGWGAKTSSVTFKGGSITAPFDTDTTEVTPGAAIDIKGNIILTIGYDPADNTLTDAQKTARTTITSGLSCIRTDDCDKAGINATIYLYNADLTNHNASDGTTVDYSSDKYNYNWGYGISIYNDKALGTVNITLVGTNISSVNNSINVVGNQNKLTLTATDSSLRSTKNIAIFTRNNQPSTIKLVDTTIHAEKACIEQNYYPGAANKPISSEINISFTDANLAGREKADLISDTYRAINLRSWGSYTVNLTNVWIDAKTSVLYKTDPTTSCEYDTDGNTDNGNEVKWAIVAGEWTNCRLDAETDTAIYLTGGATCRLSFGLTLDSCVISGKGGMQLSSANSGTSQLTIKNTVSGGNSSITGTNFALIVSGYISVGIDSTELTAGTENVYNSSEGNRATVRVSEGVSVVTLNISNSTIRQLGKGQITTWDEDGDKPDIKPVTSLTNTAAMGIYVSNGDIYLTLDNTDVYAEGEYGVAIYRTGDNGSTGCVTDIKLKNSCELKAGFTCINFTENYKNYGKSFTVTIEDSTLTAQNGLGIRLNGTNAGTAMTLTVKNSTITTNGAALTDDTSTADVNEGYNLAAIYLVDGNYTLNISGDSKIKTTNASSSHAIWMTAGSVNLAMTMTGGEVYAANGNGVQFSNGFEGTFNLSGGSITSAKGSGVCIGNSGDIQFTLSGGTITSQKAEGVYFSGHPYIQFTMTGGRIVGATRGIRAYPSMDNAKTNKFTISLSALDTTTPAIDATLSNDGHAIYFHNAANIELSLTNVYLRGAHYVIFKTDPNDPGKGDRTFTLNATNCKMELIETNDSKGYSIITIADGSGTKSYMVSKVTLTDCELINNSIRLESGVLHSHALRIDAAKGSFVKIYGGSIDVPHTAFRFREWMDLTIDISPNTGTGTYISVGNYLVDPNNNDTYTMPAGVTELNYTQSITINGAVLESGATGIQARDAANRNVDFILTMTDTTLTTVGAAIDLVITGDAIVTMTNCTITTTGNNVKAIRYDDENKAKDITMTLTDVIINSTGTAINFCSNGHVELIYTMTTPYGATPTVTTTQKGDNNGHFIHIQEATTANIVLTNVYADAAYHGIYRSNADANLDSFFRLVMNGCRIDAASDLFNVATDNDDPSQQYIDITLNNTVLNGEGSDAIKLGGRADANSVFTMNGGEINTTETAFYLGRQITIHLNGVTGIVGKYVVNLFDNTTDVAQAKFVINMTNCDFTSKYGIATDEAVLSTITLRDTNLRCTHVVFSMKGVTGSVLNIIGGIFTNAQSESVLELYGYYEANIYAGYFRSENTIVLRGRDYAKLNVYGGYFELAPAEGIELNKWKGVVRIGTDAAGAGTLTNIYGGTFVAPDDAPVYIFCLNKGRNINLYAFNAKGGMAVYANQNAANVVLDYPTAEKFYSTNTPVLTSGAQVRLVLGENNEGGIRFVSTLPASIFAYLQYIADNASDITFGTLIAPLDYVQQVPAFTADLLASAGLDYLEIEAKNGLIYNADGSVTIRAAITGIKEKNYDRAFAAIAFAKYTVNGEVVYLYSYFDEQANARSIKQLAERALADTAKIQTSIYRFPVGDGTYSRYTDEQRAAMSLYVNCQYAEEILIAPGATTPGLKKVWCDSCGTYYEELIPPTGRVEAIIPDNDHAA